MFSGGGGRGLRGIAIERMVVGFVGGVAAVGCVGLAVGSMRSEQRVVDVHHTHPHTHTHVRSQGAWIP